MYEGIAMADSSAKRLRLEMSEEVLNRLLTTGQVCAAEQKNLIDLWKGGQSMRNRDMEQIGRTWAVQNKKKHRLKGCGLFNFDSPLNPADNISEQIKRDILRKFGKSHHESD